MRKHYVRSANSIALIALAGCASIQEGIQQAALYADQAMSAPEEVVGTYELTRFQGRPLPVEMDQMVGQPCVFGGMTGAVDTADFASTTRRGEETQPGSIIEVATFREATITLSRSYKAELRGAIQTMCSSTSGGYVIQDLPQDMDGRFTLTASEVHVFPNGSSTPLRFTLDRVSGEMTQVDGPFAFARVSDEATPQNTPTRVQATSELGPTLESRGATLDRASSEVKAVRPPAHTPVLLPFSPLSDEMTAFYQRSEADQNPGVPIAAVGDTLTVFDQAHGFRRLGAVVARELTLEGPGRYCGNVVGSGEWFYQIDLASSELPFTGDARWPTIEASALPGVVELSPYSEAPASVRAGFSDTFRLELQRTFEAHRTSLPRDRDEEGYRLQVFSSSGVGLLDEAPIIAVRGPRGETVYWLSITLNDDPGFYGIESTRLTYVLDGQGMVLQREPGTRKLIAVLDLDGDGVDEVLSRGGVTRFVGGALQFAPADPEAEIC